MKRDLDRIRAILFECEESQESSFEIGRRVSPSDRYQIEKMAEAGLVEIHDPSKESGEFRVGGMYDGMARFNRPVTYKLTWAGHDYLDAVRQEGVWENTKSVVAENGGSMALELVKAIAIALGKKQLEQRTGLKL